MMEERLRPLPPTQAAFIGKLFSKSCQVQRICLLWRGLKELGWEASREVKQIR